MYSRTYVCCLYLYLHLQHQVVVPLQTRRSIVVLLYYGQDQTPRILLRNLCHLCTAVLHTTAVSCSPLVSLCLGLKIFQGMISLIECFYCLCTWRFYSCT